MTPAGFVVYEYDGVLNKEMPVFGTNEMLGLWPIYNEFKAGVRPVISLKADALISGTGNYNDPFVVGG